MKPTAVQSGPPRRGSADSWPDAQLWAKWGTDGRFRYPLLAHLLDSFVAAEAVLDWIPEARRAHLANVAGLDEAQLARVITLSAGLHDLGKVTPVFQTQALAAGSESFEAHAEALRASGYFTDIARLRYLSEEERALVARHETASAVLISPKDVLEPNGGAAVIAGHHGRWNFFGDDEAYDFPAVCDYYERVGASQWGRQADSHIAALNNVAGGAWSDLPEISHASAIPLLTGLVCLADWIASDEASISEGTRHLDRLSDPKAYVDLRREWLHERVHTTLGTPSTPTSSFLDVFGFKPDRPVQKAMVVSHDPGLSIVSVPMGEGKTEAALGHWMLNGNGRGLYFALPTMATSDAMFDRVRDFLEHSPEPVLGKLAHGRSLLNSFYDDDPNETTPVTDHDGGMRAKTWFTGRHRGLLAPVTVGTIDQLLSAALRHKYNFLRLLGVYGKTVVLDEVHSYDPYMSALLERFLQWAGHLQIDVVILSATLPKRRAQAYLDAYRGVRPDDPVHWHYPSVLRATSNGAVSNIDLSCELSGRETSVDIDYLPTSSQRLVADVVARVKQLQSTYQGAKIGVIVNTVGNAQAVGAALEDALVLHSRYPARLKAELTTQAISRFGKNSAAGAKLLVATQIVEQSIDLDFDILISQEAPATALLQRIGRLWRHDLTRRERSRPTGMQGPLVIVTHQHPQSESAFAYLPYAAAEIHHTWVALGQRRTLKLPSDMQEMVDAADVSLADLGTELTAAEEMKIIADATLILQANSRLIPPPGRLDRGIRGLELFSTNADIDAAAATRWSTLPSSNVLLTSRDRPWTFHSPLPDHIGRDELRTLLSATLTVSGAIQRNLATLNAPDTTLTGISRIEGLHPMLDDTFVLDLDAAQDWVVLDPRLGLMAV